MTIPSLSPGAPQTVLLIVFVLIAVILVAIFAAIALNSRKDVPTEEVVKKGYAIRRWWLVALVVLLVTQVAISLAFMPFRTDGSADVVVKVDGYQFNWNIDKPRVPAGSLTQFDVTSSDVTHGIGLYNPAGELLASVQAMPGYTNSFEVALDKPGKYLVACLEYCGLGHHKMLRQIEVYEENR